MVAGLDKFREHFADYQDQYLLIGGAAAWLLLDEAGLDARATKDLDIVLAIEVLDPRFAAARRACGAIGYGSGRYRRVSVAS